jgi:hypothetical protein
VIGYFPFSYFPLAVLKSRVIRYFPFVTFLWQSLSLGRSIGPEAIYSCNRIWRCINNISVQSSTFSLSHAPGGKTRRSVEQRGGITPS